MKKEIRIILINPDKKINKETYILPDGMNGETWSVFKRDYFYFINEKIINATGAGKPDVIISIDDLPILNDNFEDLKLFMEETLLNPPGHIFTVPEWNAARQRAKLVFTFPCIARLDSSGFITQLTNKAKKLKLFITQLTNKAKKL